MGSRFYGTQFGSELQREMDKTHGTGIFIQQHACPVCGGNRRRGNHAKCSKITQQKYLREKDELHKTD